MLTNYMHTSNVLRSACYFTNTYKWLVHMLGIQKLSICIYNINVEIQTTLLKY